MIFDASDKINHGQMQKQRVWALIDRIEHLTGKMVHEIPILEEKLKEYQESKLKPSQFIMFLTRFIDDLDGKQKQ